MKKKKKQETYLFYLIKTIIKKIMVSTEMNIIIVCNIYIYICYKKKKIIYMKIELTQLRSFSR